ncbi:1-phosphatidylinositol phosphodiesterase precursor [Fusarium albosuccineum]|uniref:1-phosphatidylinositol phosphodiesterase n=1 Tax=Fusarium albosuccineum TaxID=1237068 RepID=A0A8H4LHJ1_9HYPO|nr:1-phosphatidylinositol phosphodiesterase precursor [Fusarium albosuccineum]
MIAIPTRRGLSGFLNRPRRLPMLLGGTVVFIMCLFYLLLSIAPCLVYGSCYRGYASDFSFDADLAHNPTWMAELPDDVPLSSLSVPGTHDTMTYEIGTEVLQCQNWNISTQLMAGVRYFDIRARVRDDALHIYHANGYTGFSFLHVLEQMSDFLDKYPSETIIMRLKQEGNGIGKNTITFEDAFNHYAFGDHLYNYSSSQSLPTLGEIRSKIFVLENFRNKLGPYGVKWDGPQMILEDLWIIPDVYHLSEKWTAIREALELAATAPHDNKVLYLAHLSASVGVLPIEAAAGPMNRTISGMNDMTGQWIEDFEGNPDATRTGIIIIDFPGQRLIDAILRWNKPLMKHVRRRRHWSMPSFLS